jgi:hypothetical protein
MWPFNKNQDESSSNNMSPELNDYYQAEKRQRTLMTWGLGVLTLLVTTAIVFGLFIGGRWMARKFQDKTNDKPSTAQQDGEASADQTPGSSDSPGTSSGDNNQFDPGASTQNDGEETDEGQTSSATTNLPNTGPTETLAVFMSVTILATFAHKLATRE